MARIHRRTIKKKDLHNPDNHDGVITYLEPDILKCEVKWALEWSYFKSWKMMLWKAYTQYASKFGEFPVLLPGKGQFSFQSQWKAIPNNAQTAAQLHSFHTLVKFKILQARLQQYMKREFPDVQDGFRKGKKPRDQIANIWWITKKVREFQKKHLFLLYWLC